MDLSADCGQAFTAARAAQDVLAAFAGSARATHPSRQEPPAMSGDSAKTARSAIAADISARANVGSPVATTGMIALWATVDVDVSAVIGPRGSAAVLRRALATVRRTHGWLPEPLVACSFDACVKSLNHALDGRKPEEAVEGRMAVQAAFRDLLASLVGATLTGQLLGAAWPVPPMRGERMP